MSSSVSSRTTKGVFHGMAPLRFTEPRLSPTRLLSARSDRCGKQSWPADPGPYQHREDCVAVWSVGPGFARGKKKERRRDSADGSRYANLHIPPEKFGVVSGLIGRGRLPHEAPVGAS